MCLLILKPQYIYTGKLYEAIENGSHSNPDGCGFALKRKQSDSIMIRKNYDKAITMIDDLKKLNIVYSDELMVHLRLATAGKCDHQNAHPYILSRSDDCIKTTKNDKILMPVMGHNGIFSGYGNKEMSDTHHFILKVMCEPLSLRLLLTNPERFFEHEKIKSIISWSRIAIMYPYMSAKWFGYKETIDGIHFSNGGHGIKASTPSLPPYYDRDNDDDYDNNKYRSNMSVVNSDNIIINHTTEGEVNKIVKTLKRASEDGETAAVYIQQKASEYSIIHERLAGKFITDNDINIDKEDIEKFINQPVDWNTTTLISFPTKKAIYKKLWDILCESNMHKYAWCKYFKSNIVEIFSAMQFIEDDVKRLYSNISYEELLNSTAGSIISSIYSEIAADDLVDIFVRGNIEYYLFKVRSNNCMGRSDLNINNLYIIKGIYLTRSKNLHQIVMRRVKYIDGKLHYHGEQICVNCPTNDLAKFASSFDRSKDKHKYLKINIKEDTIRNITKNIPN